MAEETNISLASSLISTATDIIEKDAANRGGFNHSCARLIGESARLLGRDDLIERVECLLRTLTPESYWAGAITNFALPDKLPDSVFRIADRPSVLEWHPVYNDAYLDKLLATEREQHIQLCLVHEFDAAIAVARSNLQQTEVVLTAAVLGELEVAGSLVSKLYEQHRSTHAYLVLAIECYRRDRIADAKRMERRIGRTLDTWSMCYLAIGITNHVPWMGYPYPDD